MKKTLHLTAFLIFVIFTSIQAQDNEGFDDLDSEDFQTAQTKFEALYKSKKTKVIGAHGLATLYADDEFEGKDLTRAYVYAAEGTSLYRGLNSKQKSKLRASGWKYRNLLDVKNKISEEVIGNAKSKNTETAYTEVLQNFKLKYADRDELYRLRNAAVLEAARLGDTYADYAEIYEKYPRKDFTRYTSDIAAMVDLLLFERYVGENGYDNLEQFKEAHPKSYFAKDGGFNAFIEANKKGTIAAFDAFFLDNSKSRLIPIAKKKYRQLKKQELIESLRDMSDKEAFENMQDWFKPNIDSAFWDVVAHEMLDFEPRLKDYPFYRDFVDIINRPSENIRAVNLEILNSSKGEYCACPSADMKTIYFCGNGRADGLGGEDIFYSELEGNEWTTPKIFEGVNTGYSNEAPLSVTTDGTRILLFEAGELSYIDKTSSGWTAPKKFKSPLNEFGWQADAQITPNGLGMLFAARDSYGNIDIYYTPKIGNGWGKPINIGATINTKGEDRSPYLHFDNQTMYFTSSGHGGLGSADLFISTRLDDTWTNWSKPINMGKDFNNSQRNWGYQIASDGKRAFFSSGDKLGGVARNDDLYEIELPKRYRPGNVTVIKAQVDISEVETKQFFVENAKTGELIGIYKADPKTGKLVATIPEGIETTIRLEAKGFISRPTPVDINRPNEIKIDEYKLEEGNKLSFSDLLFDTDSDVISNLFYGELDRVAEATRNSDKRITVVGHTDNQGNEDYNLSLSQRRAQAVKAYLVERGIPEYRMTATGYGESQPISDNDTEEGRRRNRRVVLKFEK